MEFAIVDLVKEKLIENLIFVFKVEKAWFLKLIYLYQMKLHYKWKTKSDYKMKKKNQHIFEKEIKQNCQHFKTHLM